MEYSTNPRKILVAVAWPYASGSRHLGHLAGAYLPSDIFARYHRAIGNDVLMVSGSDVHGTPITVRAETEGVTPQEIVDRYHAEIVDHWDRLGFDWDLFTTTGTENHHAVTQDVFLRLHEKGYIEQRSSEQFYDPEAKRFLPDRYVEGTCPHCDYTEARGDQCDNCGRTLDPIDLINPRSKMTGATPEQRTTDHFYLKLSEFSERLRTWLEGREGWRKHVLNFSLGWIEEGLHDRAITRDIDWGVDIPVEGLGEGKKIYVWFDAVIGYLSASKEWAADQGTPDSWQQWWHNDEAEHYYFIGKDNIPFHTIIWPSILMGYGGLHLPTDVPANQYVTFKGGKASASRGIGMTIGDALERYEPDALRYAMAANLPETADVDITEAELVRRINEELVATWGNLVNRVVSMTHRYFDGVVPSAGEPEAADLAVLDSVDQAMAEASGHLSAVRLRAALATLLLGAQSTNQYLSEVEPWKTAKTDMDRTGTTLNVALQAIAGLAAGFAPFLPVTSISVMDTLGLDTSARQPRWVRPEVAPGTTLGPAVPLFSKVELPADVD
ncbi:MAG: methionine--tRNA ligase [Acidimicrobiia bacterium]|nr:methionine--tRNA ligase [Acidimicrobiia bacterium]MDX2467819.1 methionine--tRNA ligase [Acidimicrobiia bacterium]